MEACHFITPRRLLGVPANGSAFPSAIPPPSAIRQARYTPRSPGEWKDARIWRGSRVFIRITSVGRCRQQFRRAWSGTGRQDDKQGRVSTEREAGQVFMYAPRTGVPRL